MMGTGTPPRAPRRGGEEVSEPAWAGAQHRRHYGRRPESGRRRSRSGGSREEDVGFLGGRVGRALLPSAKRREELRSNAYVISWLPGRHGLVLVESAAAAAAAAAAVVSCGGAVFGAELLGECHGSLLEAFGGGGRSRGGSMPVVLLGLW